MHKPKDLKVLGKLLEELGELVAAGSRCLIQGIDESEPVTNKINRKWLEDEIADVNANIVLVVTHFGLNLSSINERSARKIKRLSEWHHML